MKILKITGIVIAALVALILLGMIIGPRGIKMERSIVIHAPRSIIFNNIADYRNFQKWSPWSAMDSGCHYEYPGPQGQADAGFKWSGNDQVGTGEMRTTEIAPDVSMVAQMNFIKPWNAKAVTRWTLDSVGPGAINVTWGFEQRFRIRQRPMMLFLNMEKMLAPDYEKGLANLKAVCERAVSAAAAAPEVKEGQWSAKTYVAYRSQVSFAAMHDVFQKYMPKIFDYVSSHKMELAGPATGLYFTWDTVKKTTDLAIAVPVKTPGQVSGDFTIISVDASAASYVDHYGTYDDLGAVHNMLQKHLADKDRKAKLPVIEEYVTDPTIEEDPQKVLTRIYYLY